MTELQERAKQHLMLHFSDMSGEPEDIPVIVRGEGSHVFDDLGNRFIDGLSGLYCLNLGHSHGEELGQLAAAQMSTLPYTSNWTVAHPPAIELATKLAEIAPDGFERVFFTSGGSESVESAYKMAIQWHQANGEPLRRKVIARRDAYHGVTLGALSFTGIPVCRTPFEPLPIPTSHVSSTNAYRHPAGGDEAAFTKALLAEIEEVVEFERPETIAMMIMEPVQNAGGSIVPPAGYWDGLREICDRYGILLVADEVINAFGRLGDWFGSAKYGVVPDLLTFAKGATSGYAPLGGVLIRQELANGLLTSPQAGVFTHGATWGGHPVSTAVAVANIRAMRDEHVLDNVRTLESHFQQGLDRIRDAHPSIREWRGTGFFYALEFMGDRTTGRELTDQQQVELVREVMPRAMREVNLITRPDDRGATLLMLSPPLVADREVLDELLSSVDAVVSAVDAHVRG